MGYKKIHYGVEELIQRYPSLSVCKEDILAAYQILEEGFETGHKLLLCGNGGSCSDSEHIVGELMKSFLRHRPLFDKTKEDLIKLDSEDGKILADNLQLGFPCIALDSHPALGTAFSNDVPYGSQIYFAQQVNILGKQGDMLLGITTSGNSKNVYDALLVAKEKGMKTIALTGKTGGKVKNIADITIKAPSEETFMIQEYHLPIYHCLCLMLEEHFFPE